METIDIKDVNAEVVKIINELANRCHSDAVRKGFWESTPDKGNLLMLMVSELAEALEGLRGDNKSDKLEGFSAEEEELADTVIRILDYSGAFQLRIGEAITAKLTYNKLRQFKHGKKF